MKPKAGVKRQPAKLPPIVRFQWHDAWGEEGKGEDDGDPSTWPVAYPCELVGFLLAETDGVVVTCADIKPNGDGYRDVSYTPRSLVAGEIEELRAGGQPRDTAAAAPARADAQRQAPSRGQARPAAGRAHRRR